MNLNKMEHLWNRGEKIKGLVDTAKAHVQNPVKYTEYDLHRFDHDVQGAIIAIQVWRDEVLSYMKENQEDD